jgi:uncharacterized protein
MFAHDIAEKTRERLIEGNDNWWFLGPGGTARLNHSHVRGDGTLTTAAEQELRERGLYTEAPPRAYGLTVLTSTDCNLGCAYCFQNTGQDPTGGNRPPRIAHARLTSQVITSALEFAGRKMASAGLDKLRLTVFGGEPLLNPRGCTELLERAADYGMTSAQMISNLTLLTPQLAKRLADSGLSSIQVTFDGDRADHDQIRVRRSGGGSFDSIVRNMARASEVTSLRWLMRVNVSHHNKRGINDLLARLGESLDPSRCIVYFARVADVGIGYANDLGHTEDFAELFLGWHRQVIEAGFAVPRPGAYPACATCSYRGGRFGAVVNADGTLSSCWDTAGRDGWDVGTIESGYRPDREIDDRWVTCTDANNYAGGQAAWDSFQDRVDAALLDYLARVKRL